LKCEIEKKNQFSKRKRKKIKRMSIKIYIKTKIIFSLKSKLKRTITFIKGSIKKIKIKIIRIKLKNIILSIWIER